MPAPLLAGMVAALVVHAIGLKAAQSDQAPPHWMPQYDPEHSHRMINTHGPWSEGRIQLPPPTDKHILVVPKLKLIFCFIPKVACTQFNRLMNDLNGMTHRLGENCGNHDPIFASSVRYRHSIGNAWSWDLMEDPSWTKAVFLRDPLERLVSAHRSKCENDECGGCLEHNFTKGIMEDLLVNDNMHYLPQRHFCGDPHRNETLETTLKNYHFVGHVTEDHAKVAHQVESMLHLALKRRESHTGETGLIDFAAAGADVKIAKDSLEAGFTQESLSLVARKYFTDRSEDNVDVRAPDSRPENDEQLPADAETLDSVAETYFPRSAITSEHAGSDHDTGVSREFASRYFTTQTLEVALEYYAKDYRVLPGLSVPRWVDQTLECLRITTGDGIDDSGHLRVMVEIVGENGPVSTQAAEGFFSRSSTVLDKCWGQVLSVRVQSSGPDSWRGSVELSPDGRVSFGTMRCSECSSGNSRDISVASTGGSRISGEQAQASCLDGAACELLKEESPPPRPSAAPARAPAALVGTEGLQEAIPSGYTQAGRSCNCGHTIAEWSSEQTIDLCAEACEGALGCAAFAVWNSPATFKSMCRLFDKNCEENDGRQPCDSFNRLAGASPGSGAAR